jgi:hypothetical protein
LEQSDKALADECLQTAGGSDKMRNEIVTASEYDISFTLKHDLLSLQLQLSAFGQLKFLDCGAIGIAHRVAAVIDAWLPASELLLDLAVTYSTSVLDRQMLSRSSKMPWKRWQKRKRSQLLQTLQQDHLLANLAERSLWSLNQRQKLLHLRVAL